MRSAVSLASSRATDLPDTFHDSGAQCWRPDIGASPPGCTEASTALCAGMPASARAARSPGATGLSRAGGAAAGVRCRLSAPLHATRPIADAFGVALLLTAPATGGALPRLQLRLSDAPATIMGDAGLESLRASVPAARSLPLLERLAQRRRAERGTGLSGHRPPGGRGQTLSSITHGSPAIFLTRAECACCQEVLRGTCSASAVAAPAIARSITRCAPTASLAPPAPSNTRRRPWPSTARCCKPAGMRQRLWHARPAARRVELAVARLDDLAHDLLVSAVRLHSDAVSALYSFALHDRERTAGTGAPDACCIGRRAAAQAGATAHPPPAVRHDRNGATRAGHRRQRRRRRRHLPAAGAPGHHVYVHAHRAQPRPMRRCSSFWPTA